MTDLVDNDSDNDEGFMPAKIQIKKQEVKLREIKQRPLDYLPRYINNTIPLKKQPLAIYQRFAEYIPAKINDTMFEHSSNSLEQRKDGVKLRYEEYFTNKGYRLVYNRMQKNEKQNQTKTIETQIQNSTINLTEVLREYEPEDYSVLRKREELLNSSANQLITNMLKSAAFGTHQAQIQQNHGPKELIFDSKFQGGNLMHAFRYLNSSHTYMLFMQNDTNTKGYNQWFYFSIKNAEPGIPYRFHILNFRKRKLLFRDKMKISVFSLVEALKNKNKGSAWYKMGENIKYERSPIRSEENIKYYCLSFTLTFAHQNDHISISMNPPYTYSRLIHNMQHCQSIIKGKNQIKWDLKTIAHSLANNAIPYITLQQIQKQKIQSPIIEKPPNSPKQMPKLLSSSLLKSLSKLKSSKVEQQEQLSSKINSQQQQKQQNKKMIIFLARQHPGETWSSFLMEQILYHFAQNCQNSHLKWLFEHYIIKIFPMINVDGVIYGNFRCDLAGFDLNRTWKQPHRELHPQIYAIRNQIEKLNQQYKIQCVFDLHGHSKQYNVFCYACQINQATARVLPRMISQRNSLFHFPYCSFGLSKYKESTARAVIHRITNQQNVLTIENSFYGMKIGSEYKEFQPAMLEKMATSIIEALIQYLRKGESQQKVEKQINKNLRSYIKMQERESADSGSDSDPYEDQIPIKQKITKIFPKKFANVKVEKDAVPKKSPVRPKKKSNQKMVVPEKKVVPQMPTIKIKPIVEKQQKPEPKVIYPKTINKQKNTKIIKVINNQLLKNQVSYQKANKIDLSLHTSQNQPSSHDLHSTSSNLFSIPFNTKPKIIPVSTRKDSLQMFKDAYSSNTKKMQAQVQRTLQRSHNSTMSGIKTKKNEPTQNANQNSSKKEILPLLCIFSEKKKAEEEERREKKRIHQDLSLRFKQIERTSKVEKAKQLDRQKRKQKSWSVMSRDWRNNFSKFGLNVFFGEME